MATDTKSEGTYAKYQKLQAQRDEKGEPSCNAQPVMGHVEDVVDLGLSFGTNAVPVHAWAVHIKNPAAEGYALFGEAVTDAPKTSSLDKPKPVGSFGWDRWQWRRTWQVVAW